MTDDKKWKALLGLGLAVLALAVALPPLHSAWRVRRAVAHNVEARGGQAAWDKVQAVRFTGSMDIGKGQTVPFRLEQARPDQSCLSFEFAGASVVQCTSGEVGWKEAPFTGHEGAQGMDEAELREARVGADPRGLLIDYSERGHDIRYLGEEDLEGRPAEVLQVSLPGGAKRTLYLDQETGLELQLVSTRLLLREERRVVTVYSDWSPTEGLLFARRQTTRTDGDEAWHALEVKTLQVNPPLDPARFEPPPGLGRRTAEGSP